MTCSCYCHDAEFYSTKFISAFDSCTGCASWHEPESTDPLMVDHKTVRAFVIEETVTQDHPYSVARFTWRVRLGDSLMSDYTIYAVVSKEHMATDYMGATEEAHRMLAKEVNIYWKKHGQSAWARMQVAQQQQGKLGQGGHATVSPDWYFKPNEVVGGQTVVRDLKRWLPGLEEVVVCPAKAKPSCKPCSFNGMVCTHDMPVGVEVCGYTKTVRELIVHLNDGHRWDRHAVADWLETLDVDLSFGAEPPKELPKAKRGEKLVIIGHTLKAAEMEAKRRNRGPREVELASSQQGHQRVVERLRGHRDFQYVVLPSTYLAPEVLDLLEWAEAVEVGEEEEPAEKDYIEKIKAEMEYMHQQYLLKKSTPAPIHPAYYEEIMQLAGYLDKEVLGVQKKPVTFNFIKDETTDWFESKAFHEPKQHACKGPDCGVCKLAEVNAHVEAQQKALDAKKKSSHTHFTVNPTKKSPFKK